MYRDYFEVHEAEYEAMVTYQQEQEDLAQMDEDFILSGGTLWD